MSDVTYVHSCSETLLTRDALFETLVFLYQPRTEVERGHLLRFAMGVCDSWEDVYGNPACWIRYGAWLRENLRLNGHLTSRDLALIGAKIEEHLDAMMILTFESHAAPIVSSPEAVDGVIHVDYCTGCSLTLDALIATLSFMYQPQSEKERRQLRCFASVLCRVWAAVDGDEEYWRSYSSGLRARLDLPERLSGADLASLSETMDEDLEDW